VDNSSNAWTWLDVNFWSKIWGACRRIFGLAVLIILHSQVHRLLELFVFKDNSRVREVASIISLVGFLVVYTAVVIDMIRVS